MAKYRKKPVVIEAVRFIDTEENYEEIMNFFGETTYTISHVQREPYIIIDTLEGRMKADVGDYIIRGVNGEYYPCKADIFAKTYELAE